MRSTSRSTRALVIGAAVAVIVLLNAACEPVKLGGPGAAVGNAVDPVACPQHQPVPQAPCGPQPLVWAAMSGPYENYENGDPYSTKCAPGGGSGTSCVQGNPSYRTSGYSYVVDVAATDVGRPLTVQAYDLGSFPRRVGLGSASAIDGYDVSDVGATQGSATISSASGAFRSGSAGLPVFGSFCPGTCRIVSVIDASTATMSTAASQTGEFNAQIGYDCNTAKTPFTSASSSSIFSGSCQTGDSGTGQNLDIEVFDTDGSAGPSYASPLPGCHFSRRAAEMAAAVTTYKNAWVTLCSFTPTATGAYTVRVRNSGIAGMVDSGTGYDSYALKVAGGIGSSLRPVEDHSIYVNAVSSTSVFYVADVPAGNAGRTLVVDVYDAGDGTGVSQAVMQLRAPPGGTSSTPAWTGVVVPAAGIASSCRYNPTPSVSLGAETTADAASCAVVTHVPDNNIYNGKWLRFEVALDPAYTCSTDCRWTMRYNWGTGGVPTDRIVFSAKVV